MRASTADFTNVATFDSAYSSSVDLNKKIVITLSTQDSNFTANQTLWALGSGINNNVVNRLITSSSDIFNATLFYYVYPGYEVANIEEDINTLWKDNNDLTPLLYPDGYKSIFFVLDNGDYFGICVTHTGLPYTGYNNGSTVIGVTLPINFIVYGNTTYPIYTWSNIVSINDNGIRGVSSFAYASTSQRNCLWMGILVSNSIDMRGWEEGKVPSHDSDPYTPGGETEEGGGTGTFDNTTESIPVPDLPTTSAVETGFISLYKPSLTQLKALATYLWSANGLDLDTFKRIFSDPISAILGLSLVPIDPGLGNDVNVVLGNIATGVTMPRVPQQYQKFNCGSLQIQEYWGGYLDYAPYTRAEIYLPFIGVKPLNIDDIMGKTVSLWYVVDFLSGGCVACLECGGSVLYQFIGQCACSIPITGNDMTNVINGILSVVGAGVGTMVATGGMGLAGLAVTGALASNVMGMKSHVEKSGSMGGMGGMLGVKTPYIILTRPRQALPATQNKFTGYPSFITTTLGSCEGYTVVSEVHLENISATEDEKREIEQLLKGGVIL